jgi:hypothetical protein
MKKAFWVIIILLIIAAVVAALQRGAENTEDVNNQANSGAVGGTMFAAEEVTLRVGETRPASGLQVKLNDFVQDNRCGIDAFCTEAGGVTVNVTLQSPGETITRNMASDEAAYEFSGYKVSIPKIEPSRRADETIRESDYRITFYVEPVALSNPAQDNAAR